jgi:hypothetical protein
MEDIEHEQIQFDDPIIPTFGNRHNVRMIPWIELIVNNQPLYNDVDLRNWLLDLKPILCNSFRTRGCTNSTSNVVMLYWILEIIGAPVHYREPYRKFRDERKNIIVRQEIVKFLNRL